MKFVFALAVLVLAIAAGEGQMMLECTDDICNFVTCDENVTCANCERADGVYEEYGGFCGCCPICLEKVYLGGVCGSYFEIIFGIIPNRICEPGTTCQMFNATTFTCQLERCN